MSRRHGAIIVGVLVLLLLGAFGITAYAENQSATGTDKLATAYDNFVTKLAANLGLEKSQVSTALETTRSQVLDEAVQQGKITQEQADKMKSKPGMGGFYGVGPMKGHRPGDKGTGNSQGMMQFRGKHLEGTASILGMTVDQLQAELKAGKKLSQLITDHGLTQEQFNQKMLEYQKQQITQAVTDGKLTQEQADKMIQRLEQRGANPGLRGAK
ncbi:MAG: DUF2680 domain-containing protein [Firmicutes bacterium]|nr:DUF2680 domain-containing protein [Bacillota bacterium]